jgi:hypothetical protein
MNKRRIDFSGSQTFAMINNEPRIRFQKISSDIVGSNLNQANGLVVDRYHKKISLQQSLTNNFMAKL